MIRHPAVAGQFYKRSSEALANQVQQFLVPSDNKLHALGILSPHAGLIYSGRVAGAVYSRIELPDTIVLIGPNHTGMGAPVALMAAGQWETPLGAVEIDEALAAAILSSTDHIQEDSRAHVKEHSLEVQLPFIQYLKQDAKIVPIQMLDTRSETCRHVGNAIAQAIMSRNLTTGTTSQRRNVLIVASSDMSHYEPAVIAREKDFKAIQAILDLDPEGLYRQIREQGITMCGYGPAAVMLHACNMLGASKAELVMYTNSGDVSGDYDQVVGYAGIVVM